MKYLNYYRYFFICFFLAILPFTALSFADIREYIFDNFMVSAIYNGVIIVIYITGSLCALFTILKNISAKDILTTQDANRTSTLLSNLNQVLFSDNSKHSDINLLMELDDNVTTARNQRLSFIMSCSNVSTLIGLLGTFAGLSITIGSIGNLLSTPSDVGAGSASNTLNMIVTMVASLSEPLKGMNTAFVSSIYGVVCAILLTSQSVFVRSSYSLVSSEVKKLKIRSNRANNKQRSLRVESETLVEFKELFKEFFDNYLSVETLRTQDEEKKRVLLSDGFSALQNRLLDNATKLEQLSTLVGGYLESSNTNQKKLADGIMAVTTCLSEGNALLADSNAKLETLSAVQNIIDKKNDSIISSIDKCYQEAVSHSNTINDIAAGSANITTVLEGMRENIATDMNNVHLALSDLSVKDKTIIANTKEIAAEVVSYRDTYFPLMEKITSMHQRLIKQSVLHGETKNED
ncbi:MotA/TolQ/ExbB proton channel family protein [Salmonella enterica subsp. salamae]|nr:MotA/TolQ/ExbB proton channel family protein [Salmonella enterica subsp. salamae]ECJ2282895.1 MotA/TolQ/ExbB proton channel family protein [Salmonella enterica subsp. salamae]